MRNNLLKNVFKGSVLFSVFVCLIVISVYFTISFFVKSEDTVVVPDLTRLNILEAIEIISDLDLNIRISRSLYSLDYPENMVISQNPSPGTELKKGRNIKLTYSHGLEYVIVPNLKHLNKNEAKLLLENKYLHIQEITLTHNKEYSEGNIINHYPADGTSVVRGSPINLIISKGINNKKLIMPDLLGEDYKSAIQLIEKYDLVVGNITTKYEKKKYINKIISQNPLSGHVVNVHTPVFLTVNNKHISDLSWNNYSVLDLYVKRLDYGFLNKHVKLQLTINENTFIPINGFFKPGESIYFLIPGNLNESISIFVDGTFKEEKHYKLL